MNVLHIDIYDVDVELNFEGNRYNLVVACAIASFSVAEPTVRKNAKNICLGTYEKLAPLWSFTHSHCG